VNLKTDGLSPARFTAGTLAATHYHARRHHGLGTTVPASRTKTRTVVSARETERLRLLMMFDGCPDGATHTLRRDLSGVQPLAPRMMVAFDMRLNLLSAP
jgi:hypothetical protein